jgi:hypothetical protein
VDTGELFRNRVSKSKDSALKALFSGLLGYSYTAFRQAVLLHEETADDQEFKISAETWQQNRLLKYTSHHPDRHRWCPLSMIIQGEASQTPRLNWDIWGGFRSPFSPIFRTLTKTCKHGERFSSWYPYL